MIWSHKQLLNVVYFYRKRKLKDFYKGSLDIVRLKNSPDKSYFHGGLIEVKIEGPNRGRRLDHIFSSSDITKKSKK